jgi:Large polyvalent protein associated domain 29
MAYINAIEVKAIRNELKKEFPNLKFSVTKGYSGLSVDVTILSGSIDFNPLFDSYQHGKNYAQINQYHYKDRLPEYAPVFEKIIHIIKTAPAKATGKEWFDKSNAMTDYFHTAYYFHINVGVWDKPYQYLPSLKQAA